MTCYTWRARLAGALARLGAAGEACHILDILTPGVVTDDVRCFLAGPSPEHGCGGADTAGDEGESHATRAP